MNTLTEKQNLRYDLLKANKYDVKNAKACYDFVTTPEPQQAKTANGLADGVYLIQHDDTAVLFTGQTLTDTKKSLYKGVGVKLGNKSLAVAKGDITEDEIRNNLYQKAGRHTLYYQVPRRSSRLERQGKYRRYTRYSERRYFAG